MKIPKGPTVKQILHRAGVIPATISLLRPKDRATDKERAKAKESLRRRCPYLFVKRGK